MNLNIALDDKSLLIHLREPTGLTAPAGGVLPEQLVKDVLRAFQILVPRDNPDRFDTLQANFLCPMPPLVDFKEIVTDATKVLNGDLEAAQRYRDMLANFSHWDGIDPAREARLDQLHAEASLDGSYIERMIDHLESTQARTSPGESILAKDTALTLMGAAIAVAGDDLRAALRNTGVLLDQFCGLEPVGPIYRAAEMVLNRTPGGEDYLEQTMRFFGGEWGPDDGPPRPGTKPGPWPGPCPDPWPPLPGDPLLPINDGRLEAMLCTFLLLNAWREGGTYFIDSILDEHACPGSIITITGQNFGDEPGTVRFRSGGAELFIEVDPESWSDTEVTVIVPDGATCGPLRLVIYDFTREICGRFVDIYRREGSVDLSANPVEYSLFGGTPFYGGNTTLRYFSVANLRDGCMEPGDEVEIRWSTCNATNVSVKLENLTAGTDLLDLPSAAETGRHTLTLPDYDQSQRLEAKIDVSGPCIPVTAVKGPGETIEILVTRPADLNIDGVEITQGIQYYRAPMHLSDYKDWGADNSLELISDKSAWVRVYLRSGRELGFDSGQLRDITGAMTVSRRLLSGWEVISDPPIPPENAPVTAQASIDLSGASAAARRALYDTERNNTNASLNFIIPSDLMAGILKLDIEVSSTDTCNGTSASKTVAIAVILRQRLQVAALRMGYIGNNLAGAPITLAAPALTGAGNTVAAECQFALTTLPVSSNILLRDVGTIAARSPLNGAVGAGGCDPNWDPILALVWLARLSDGNRAGWIYYGFVTQNMPINNGNVGCAKNGNAAGIIGNGGTFVHEVGHVAGVPAHAPCGAVGTANDEYPLYQPYDTGTVTMNTAANFVWQDASIGEYGLDINTGAILPPSTSEDFMSYCGVVPATANNAAWISIYTHKLMVANASLNPTIDLAEIIPAGSSSGGAGGGGYVDQSLAHAPRPFIALMGYVAEDDAITVTNVARMTTRPLQMAAKVTGYRAELLGKNDQVVVAAPLFDISKYSHGPSDCTCHDSADSSSDVEPPFQFVAVLEDVETGGCLQIAKGDEVLWQKRCPKRKPVIDKVTATVTKNRFKVSWTYKVAAEREPEVWLRWSSDKGETWNGLAISVTKNNIELPLDDLPSGSINIQVVSHDGFHSVTKESAQLKIPDRPAGVSILFPNDQSTIPLSVPLHLWGAIVSRSAHEHGPDDFVWHLNGKEVGRGRDIWVDNPGVGEHEAKLSINDPAGMSEVSTSFTVA